MRSASVLAAALLSCLPGSDLSSYSQRARPSEASGVSPDSASAAAGGQGSVPVEGAPASDCSGECLPPVLLGPEPDNGAAGSEAAPENGGAHDEGMLQGSDAGAPTQAPAADAGAASCVSGAVLAPNQRCYELVSTASSWQDARTRCQARGAGWDLGKVHSAGEDAWFAAFALLGAVTDAWLGASDLQNEGTWRWLGDGTAFWSGDGSTGSRVGNAYVNWVDGSANPEPNGGATSDCLRLRTGNGWADSACSTAYASICEGPRL